MLDADPASLINPGTGILDPALIWKAAMTNEKPGGHGDRSVAVGILDMAAWDLAAKLADKPVHLLTAEQPEVGIGVPLEKVWVYAAGSGYYQDRRVDALREKMLSDVDMGCCTVKMKISGASLQEDLSRIDVILAVLPEGVSLAVDPNGRFSGEQTVEYAQAEPYWVL